MTSPREQSPPEPTALPRRTVLCGAAVLGGAGLTGALPACSNGFGSSTAPAGSSSPPATTVPPESATPDSSVTSSAAAAGRPALIATSEVPQGGGVVLSDQKVVVTQPTPAQFAAFSAVCTHQGCLVSEVAKATIVCFCHGSRFSIQDGSVTGPPAQQPLPSVPVTARDGNVVRG